MTRERLLELLREIASAGGGERGHMDADDLLLEYINDEEVTAAFQSIRKWYA